MGTELEELEADLVEARAELDAGEAVLNRRQYVDVPYWYWVAWLQVASKEAAVEQIKAKIKELKEKANEN
tara:strand:+ start:2260 stop:2469 length:210 start_codon:yes stop_codon:yes gene_type:complete